MEFVFQPGPLGLVLVRSEGADYSAVVKSASGPAAAQGLLPVRGGVATAGPS